MDKKQLLEQIERPRKVALYASLTISDCTCLFEVRYDSFDEHYQRLPEGQFREHQIKGYVRVSEPVELNFAAVDNDSITRNAIASLDEEERKAIEELNAKVARIREFKNQLLALTHQPEAVS